MIVHSKHGRSRVAVALLTLSATLGTLSLAYSTPAEAAPKVHTIVMNKMVFGPVPTGIKVGDVILWLNKDLFRHTATARDKSFDVDLAAGKSARTVVRKPGLIGYFCRFHPGMKGQLAVAK
jgi:plastocyanin